MEKPPRRARGTPGGTLRGGFGFIDNLYGVDKRSPVKPRLLLTPSDLAKYSAREREAWISELLEHAIYLVTWLTPKKRGVTQEMVRRHLDMYRHRDADGIGALWVIARVLSFLDEINRPIAPGPKRLVPLNEVVGIRFANKVARGRRSKRTLEDDMEFLSEFEAEKIRLRAEGNSKKSNEKICADWAKRLLHDAYESQAGPQGITGEQVRIIKRLAPVRGMEWATTIKRAQARIRTQKRRLHRRSVTKANN
jgi:hypothetical protein